MQPLEIDHTKLREITLTLTDLGVLFWAQVFGGSMTPTIHSGDRVAIGPLPPDGPHVGEIVVVLTSNNSVIIHRVANRLPDGHIVTQGDALPYTDPPVEPQNVLGRVIGVKRPPIRERFQEVIAARLAALPYTRLYGALIAPILRAFRIRDIIYAVESARPDNFPASWALPRIDGAKDFVTARHHGDIVAVLVLCGVDIIYANMRIRYRGLGIGRRLSEMAGRSLDEGRIPDHLRQLARLEFGLQEGGMEKKDADFSVFVPVRVLAFLWAAGLLALMFAAGYGAILGASADPRVIGIAALAGAGLLLVAPAVWLAVTW